MAGNQTENEALVQWGTGRRGVEDMLAKMGGEIAMNAAPNVKGDFNVWRSRALTEVANRDELKGIIATREGVFSVYKALAKAATMGLQIGGQYPHAWLVPMGGKAVLVPTAEGMAFAAAYGPGAVLIRSPKLEHVYEKDEFRTDSATGTVVHRFVPFGDRGKLVGYYMILEYRDGAREVATITQDKVEAIEKAYSNKGGPAWMKSAQEMHDSKASKQLLKRPAKIAEGLAMLMSLDDYEAPEPVAMRDPPMRDVTERVGAALDDAAEGMADEPKTAAKEQDASANPAEVF